MAEMAHEQETGSTLQQFYNGSSKCYCVRVIENIELLAYNAEHHINPSFSKDDHSMVPTLFIASWTYMLGSDH